MRNRQVRSRSPKNISPTRPGGKMVRSLDWPKRQRLRRGTTRERPKRSNNIKNQSRGGNKLSGKRQRLMLKRKRKDKQSPRMENLRLEIRNSQALLLRRGGLQHRHRLKSTISRSTKTVWKKKKKQRAFLDRPCRRRLLLCLLRLTSQVYILARPRYHLLYRQQMPHLLADSQNRTIRVQKRSLSQPKLTPKN